MGGEEEILNAKQKREKVKNYVLSREGENSYTQSEKRTQVDEGFSDCSSLQQRAYQEVGIEIGSYTGAQIVKGEWVQLGGELPDEAKMQIGDELFFATNYDNGRPYNVGHIEMYVGNGQISGHGSGIGPTRKNMIDYCKSRNSSGKKFIGVKRYIKNDGSETFVNKIEIDEKPMFIGKCTGDDVNVRNGPATSYSTIDSWPKLYKGNKVEVLEQIGSWFKVRIAEKHIGYVYERYILKVEEPKEEDNGISHTTKFVGVVLERLNVRTWAGKENPNIKSWPQLELGDFVDVCDTIKASNGDDWYFVRINGRIYGFVSAKYIGRA